MWSDAIFAYLHFAAIFTLLWFLAKEWTLLKAGVDQLDPRRLSLADLGYFIAAIAVLATGLTRALAGAKPWAYYAGNPVFHVKVSLFVLVGLVSIWPTLAFMRWRKAAAADPAFRVDAGEWRKVKRLVMAEMHILALILLFAVLMARGLGFHG
jgi:putative membrane protein